MFNVPSFDPEGVLLAARCLRVPATNLLMVGDYRYDIEAGHAPAIPRFSWKVATPRGA